ncbi:Helicase ARIP4 [Trichoplax sp. H2]|nr:Helicase ARIP4 [Trichoplax sp. H2]|eukprot:RDD46081.1 Helicase ARIP4 [Trichoplax sp. H2]
MKRQYPLTYEPLNGTLEYPSFFRDRLNKRKKIQPIQSFDTLNQPVLQAQREEQQRLIRLGLINDPSCYTSDTADQSTPVGTSISNPVIILDSSSDEEEIQEVIYPLSKSSQDSKTVVHSSSSVTNPSASSYAAVIDSCSKDRNSHNNNKPKHETFYLQKINQLIDQSGRKQDPLFDNLKIKDSDRPGEEENIADCYSLSSDDEELLSDDVYKSYLTLRKPPPSRGIINVNRPASETDICISPHLIPILKTHQVAGIQFLFNNVVESFKRYRTSDGLGCILAHSMGLGKTLQVVAFIEIFLRALSAKCVLCIVPLSTLDHWLNEINYWLPSSTSALFSKFNYQRPFKVYQISSNCKSLKDRANIINEWRNIGGVLIIGYDMYRILMTMSAYQNNTKKKGKKVASSDSMEIVDLDLIEEKSQYIKDIRLALSDPGPDLVICDEGHILKNATASVTKTLKEIKTKRRIVLTGYPIQNNLIEYWCMVDFVRPNYLGDKKQFSNMFERPIANGECVDSTPNDIKKMRFRSYVLQKMLKGFVQRRSQKILKDALLPKKEYVLLIRMSPIQERLYNAFIECVIKKNWTKISLKIGANVLLAFSVLYKVWNHPDVLHQAIMQQDKTYQYDILNDADRDLELELGANTSNDNSDVHGNHETKVTRRTNKTEDEGSSIDYSWAFPSMAHYAPGVLEHGGKMVILMDLIENSVKLGDRMLIFSQSLVTLSIIEHFLSKIEIPCTSSEGNNKKWAKNESYFRIDGSVPSHERSRLIDLFNSPDNNSVWLFLISTRAGNLGINLVAANRVVIYDSAWNPCYDNQAAFRIYRYGQKKPCYIYRLVGSNTMEHVIYKCQIRKQGLSRRIIDERNPCAVFTKRELKATMQLEHPHEPYVDLSRLQFDDLLMANTIKKNGHWLTRAPFEHESLLLDDENQEITPEEERQATQVTANYFSSLEKGTDLKLSDSDVKPQYLSHGLLL